MRRLLAATRIEARTAWRYGVFTLAGVVTALWTCTLAVLATPVAHALLPFLLFVDTAGFGALIAVGLVLMERVERMDTARGVTPLRPGELVAARIAVLTILAVAMTFPPVLVSGAPIGVGDMAAVCGGVAGTSVLLVGTCLALGSRAATLAAVMLRLVPAVALLVMAPVLHLSGAVRGGVLYLVPTTAGAELIRAGTTGDVLAEVNAPVAVLIWAALALVGVCAWAAHAAAPREVRSGRNTTRREIASLREGLAAPAAGVSDRARRRSPLVTLLRFDLMAGRRDALLLVLPLAPALLAILIRLGFPTVTNFVAETYGFSLASIAPMLFAVLILLHVPTIMSAVVTLRCMDDVDDRALLVLRASPLSLRGYLGYRASVAGVATLVGLLVAVPLSGIAPRLSLDLVVAVILASTSAPLFVLVVVAFAGNKVEALVGIKAVGALTVLLPILAWMLPPQASWLLLIAPPAWPLLAVPGYPVAGLPPWGVGVVLLAGLLWTLVLSGIAARRAETTLVS